MDKAKLVRDELISTHNIFLWVPNPESKTFLIGPKLVIDEKRKNNDKNLESLDLMDQRLSGFWLKVYQSMLR